MTPEQAIKIFGHTARAAVATAEGNYAEAIGHAIDAALEAADGNTGEVKRLLDERSIARANARADALENDVFGPDRQG